MGMICSTIRALVKYPPEKVWGIVTDLDCLDWRSNLSRIE